jgi:transcription antitermination factor NusG
MPLLPKETEVFPENLFELPTDSVPWLVAHVRSRQEKVLARHLERQNVPFYLPQIEKTTRRNGRTLRAYVPLFPGYVFVRGGAKAREVTWRSNVVANLIDVEDQPLVQSELYQLRQLQLSGASLTPHLDVMVGTPVRVLDGAFAGYTGVVMKEKDRERLIVTITHLHHAVAVELGRTAVARHN